MIDLAPDRITEVCRAALLTGGLGRVNERDMPARAVVDSRLAREGDLFVGIKGDRVDGGAFAEKAVEAGCWGALLAPEHALRLAAIAHGRLRVMSVDDPLLALDRLARTWTDRLWADDCKFVGITGSTGKTSTKDILLSMLRPAIDGPVHGNPRNYNTEIGLPLAVLEAEPGTKVVVLEMAMRGPGQIQQLCEIAPPEIGVITNVGPVHLELLGTIEAVAEAKAELIAALPADGACVVPALAEALHPHLRPEVRTLTFGDSPADLRVVRAEPATVGGSRGLRAEIAVLAETVTLEFNFRQAHNLVNALAAIGAAHGLGIAAADLAEGARQVRFSSLRGEEIELSGGVLVVNDCYNANPISMRAALDHLAEVSADRDAPRRVAVLGDMAELGPSASDYHREVGSYAANSGVGLLVAVGSLAPGYAEGYGSAGEVRHAVDAEEAAAVVAELVEPNDVVLVKASRSIGLERVADALRDRNGEGSG